MTVIYPSQVLNEQTSVQIDSQPTYGQLLRDSCQPQYAAAMRVYSILDGGPNRGRAERLRGCRENAWFARHIETGEVRVAASACSLRWCPVCSNARRNYITHEIAAWLEKADHPKLITLTLKHTSAPLDFQIENLYKFFRSLRRRIDFKKAVTGGIWFFQITRNLTDGTWHPHIHALITGLYLPKRRLSRMWSETTFGSFVTDIRAVHDPKSAANDVARYATSPGSLVHLSPDDAIEMVESLHGRRICGTWGTAKAIRLRPEKQGTKGTWVSLGSWSTVMGSYESNPDARAIVLSWKTGTALEDGISCNNIERQIDQLLDPAWADYDFDSIYETERSPP